MKGLLSLLFTLLLFSNCASDTKLLIAGSGYDKIALLDKKSKKIEWSFPLQEGMECNCIIMTKDGNIAFSYAKGAMLIDKNKNVLWNYTQEIPGEIHSVTELKNGNFILAVSGKPASIVELDSAGKEVNRINFYAPGESLHGQFRQICISESGNYLIPLFASNEVLEIDRKGKTVNSYKVPASPFSVIELKNNNLMAAGGDNHLLAEINRKSGKIERVIDQKNFFEKDVIHYVAQIKTLKNGNILLCNWNGHFKNNEQKRIPHLIEFDEKYNIKWRYDDFSEVSKVSAFYVVDKW